MDGFSSKRYSSLSVATSGSKSRISDLLEKRQIKLADNICLFGVKLNSGTDDPVVFSFSAVFLRATW